jgi:hypothetical protein
MRSVTSFTSSLYWRADIARAALDVPTFMSNDRIFPEKPPDAACRNAAIIA